MGKHVHWSLPGEETNGDDTFKIPIEHDTFKIPIDHDTSYIQSPPPIPARSPARPSEMVRFDFDDDEDEVEDEYDFEKIKAKIVETVTEKMDLQQQQQPTRSPPVKRSRSGRRTLSWQSWRFGPFLKNRPDPEEPRTQIDWDILNDQNNNITQTPMSPSSTASDTSDCSETTDCSEEYVDEILLQARKRWSIFEPNCPHCRRSWH
ncbi:MAG: hypothetical protein Q9160_004609 [Pyrenula sp. 1 TL-2023]